jgi:predicted metalloprotease with PDZ domain
MIEPTPSPCRRPVALVACPDCGRDVSYRAHHCVHCGAPNPGGSSGARAAAVIGLVILLVGGVVALKAAKCHRMDMRCSAPVVLTCGHQGDWDEAMSNRQDGTGYLGVRCDDSADGAVIYVVGNDSPAARIGIVPGDRIVRIGGSEIGCFHDVLGAIWRHLPGDNVTVAVRRGSETRVFDITLDKHPRD